MKMEDMSEAYVRALCACNGFSVDRPNRDNDGYDIVVGCTNFVCENSKVRSPYIHVQLKSSYSNITVNQDNSISYKLEVKNYNQLISNRAIPLILIVFHMYENENSWIEQTADWLKITKCAYWISLKNAQATENKTSITIKIPGENLLTKESLFEIMRKVSMEEEL